MHINIQCNTASKCPNRYCNVFTFIPAFTIFAQSVCRHRKCERECPAKADLYETSCISSSSSTFHSQYAAQPLDAFSGKSINNLWFFEYWQKFSTRKSTNNFHLIYDNGSRALSGQSKPSAKLVFLTIQLRCCHVRVSW